MKKAKNIMFQGTGSSVGKSLLTAAVCRILNNKGYRVAPYKSQNMALNSYITLDGKEMGRAQVVQAECARIEPQVEMNPVLLKPNSDVGCQVILNGKAEFNMNAVEYHAHKAKLTDVVMDAYNMLAESHDIIAIEGAGSPAEINLRDNDIVNMGLAEMVDAPVILIGDIDRGGVFASIYGTIKLLEPEEQARIKGFIINKFRGDVELLKPGIEMIEEKVGVPCLGVIPYQRLVIDDEDSVTERWDEQREGVITIGVVRLRHISNFTDCTVFDMYPDVKVEYYENQRELHRADPDLIVIPGSKNTIDDIVKLRESRLEEEILAKHTAGVPVLGICGGYQILGHEWLLGDEVVQGLGIVDMTTERAAGGSGDRLIDNIVLTSPLAKRPVVGYENHAGRTHLGAGVEPFGAVASSTGHGNNDADKQDGVRYKNVVGTYLHGPLLAKNPEVADDLLARALQRFASRTGQPAIELAPLDDAVEQDANDAMVKKLGVHR